MIKSACLVVLHLVFFCSVQAQRIHAEFAIPNGSIPLELQCIAMHDTLLVTYQSAPPGPGGYPLFNSFLVLPDGATTKLKLDLLKDKILCGIENNGTNKLLYFLSESRKGISLGALKTTAMLEKPTVIGDTLLSNGRLIGNDVRDNDLYLYTFSKDTYLLNVLRINQLKVVEQKKYKLSFDLSQFNPAQIAFIPEGILPGVEQASAKVKIMLQGDYINLIVDECHDQYNEKLKLYKTTVVHINTRTSETSIHVYTESTSRKFRSFLVGNYLFRAIHYFDAFNLQVFDIRSNREIYQKMLIADKAAKDIPVYFREGKANRIDTLERLHHMIDISQMCEPFIIVQNDSATNNYKITWGTYFNDKGITPLAMANPAGLMVMIVGTAIKQMGEGPGVSRYFYMQGNFDNGFDLLNDHKQMMRNKIDTYELFLQSEKKRYQRKGYYITSTNMMAMYFYSKTKKLELVAFPTSN
jgi:hypothetical protein